MRGLLLEYYFVLRSVLKTKPNLRRCLVRCCHCLIFFFTHPCNAGRKDLRCPFGCREAYGKHSSTQRSIEYYRTEQGKSKKRIQNNKRCKTKTAADIGERREEIEKDSASNGRKLDAGIAIYLCMALSLIEGRRLKLDEILAMMARIMRQHSMERHRRIDYVIAHLMANDP